MKIARIEDVFIVIRNYAILEIFQRLTLFRSVDCIPDLVI